MIRWNNDYNHGAHPEVLKAFQDTNDTSYGGYGLDEWCMAGAEEIKKYLGNVNADVHFMVGGTQVNYTVISAALRPYQGVVSADTGHIHVHETGAVEHIGHKIHALPSVDGKITAEQVRREAENYRTSGVQEHITDPRMVYISYPTEFGTLYTKEELIAISQVCRDYNLYLFVDGARMGYGLGSEVCDMTMAELAELVDIFYIGGTKCGAMLGEAVVIMREELKDHFRSYIKQNGAMLAKGWILGLQFYTLFKDGLYFKITKEADKYALRIKDAFSAKGIPAYIESFTNQQFVVVTEEQMNRLGENHVYEYQNQLEDGRYCIRFCTSWSTKAEDVDTLIADIQAL